MAKIRTKADPKVVRIPETPELKRAYKRVRERAQEEYDGKLNACCEVLALLKQAHEEGWTIEQAFEYVMRLLRALQKVGARPDLPRKRWIQLLEKEMMKQAVMEALELLHAESNDFLDRGCVYSTGSIASRISADWDVGVILLDLAAEGRVKQSGTFWHLPDEDAPGKPVLRHNEGGRDDRNEIHDPIGRQ
jgi:hypothetical protein